MGYDDVLTEKELDEMEDGDWFYDLNDGEQDDFKWTEMSYYNFDKHTDWFDTEPEEELLEDI